MTPRQLTESEIEALRQQGYTIKQDPRVLDMWRVYKDGIPLDIFHWNRNVAWCALLTTLTDERPRENGL